MRERDPGPAVQHRFAHRRDRAGVIDIRAEIAAVIDPAQHPIRIRHHMQQTEPSAIGRRAVDGETVLAPFFDAHAFCQVTRDSRQTAARPAQR